MAEIGISNYQIVWSEGENRTLVLNCKDFLRNKSSLSMHRLPGMDIPILPEIIFAVQGITENGYAQCLMALCGALTSRQLIRKSAPGRVLEYGCGSGLMSRYLTHLTAAFDRRVRLVCLNDSLDDSSTRWLEEIGKEQTLPDVVYQVGDYGAAELPPASFDVVYLEGERHFEDQEKVLRDAVRLLRDDGVLICRTCGSYLLESLIHLYCTEFEEYTLSPKDKVLHVSAERLLELRRSGPELSNARTLLAKADALLTDESANERKYLSTARKLRRCLEQGEVLADVELKIRVIDMEEQIIKRVV